MAASADPSVFFKTVRSRDGAPLCAKPAVSHAGSAHDRALQSRLQRIAVRRQNASRADTVLSGFNRFHCIRLRIYCNIILGPRHVERGAPERPAAAARPSRVQFEKAEMLLPPRKRGICFYHCKNNGFSLMEGLSVYMSPACRATIARRGPVRYYANAGAFAGRLELRYAFFLKSSKAKIIS